MADLWTLQLMFAAAQGRTVTLIYHGEAEAAAAAKRILTSPVQDEFPAHTEGDHYGTSITIFGGGPLEAMMLQEAGRAGEGGIELALIQARTQARAKDRADKDPVLQAAQQRQTASQALARAMPIPFMPPGKM